MHPRDGSNFAARLPVHWTRRHALLAVLAAAWLLGGPAQGAARADNPTLEKQVKAAFVVNFMQFIDWPAESFAKPDDPIVIGIVEGSGMEQALAAAIAGKTVRGRDLVIRTLTLQNTAGCHVLLVPAMDTAALQEATRAAGGAGVLTISDSDHFTDFGGMIQFYEDERKVRFEINLAAAERARLGISSKLLKLARVVNK